MLTADVWPIVTSSFVQTGAQCPGVQMHFKKTSRVLENDYKLDGYSMEST